MRFAGAVIMGVAGIIITLLSIVNIYWAIKNNPATNPPGGHVPPVNENKLNHIFGQSRHNLDNFLKSFNGNQANAYNAVRNAAQQHVIANNMTGIINGIFEIGTFFIP